MITPRQLMERESLMARAALAENRLLLVAALRRVRGGGCKLPPIYIIEDFRSRTAIPTPNATTQ